MSKVEIDSLQLTHVPVMETGLLNRKPVGEVFAAIVNPKITTQFWFTRGSGRLDASESVSPRCRDAIAAGKNRLQHIPGSLA